MLANGLEQHSGIKFVLDYTPWQVGAGAAYDLIHEPDQTLTAAGSLLYAGWSTYIDRHGNRPTPAYAWADTISPSAGLRYRFGTFTSSVDLQYAPTPVPKQRGRTNYVDNKLPTPPRADGVNIAPERDDAAGIWTCAYGERFRWLAMGISRIGTRVRRMRFLLSGGAMDLAIGAQRTWVMMEHTTKTGEPKVVAACSYPITGLGLREPRVYGSRGDRPRSRRCTVIDMVEGLSLEDLQASTGVPLVAALY